MLTRFGECRLDTKPLRIIVMVGRLIEEQKKAKRHFGPQEAYPAFNLIILDLLVLF